MDKKYADIHVIYRNDEFVIRQVTDICLQNKEGFIEITYRVNVDVNKPIKKLLDEITTRVIIPCVEGLKIYID